ncbi:unnamed protein product [Phytophthora fragariaefolia]|uniref:Unnamed protein product n=1 Tax=Phytophthora fragariaefolia TaxID=1490495 RepID=A0A9W7D6A9_9STRA|nr:unnamed protein product [Phytophthora fragariaefolia]
MGTTCSTSSAFVSEVTTAFGSSSPFVIVKKYAPGTTCANAQTAPYDAYSTYLADGRCYKTGPKGSFRASISFQDGMVQVLMYSSSSTCADSAPMTWTATATQVENDECIDGKDGQSSFKVYGYGESPVYLRVVGMYGSSENCLSSYSPVQLVAKVTSLESCAESANCNQMRGTMCSELTSYLGELEVMFDARSYVVVESYSSGKGCSLAALEEIWTIVADGKCYKVSPTTSFRAIRMASGAATVVSYTTSANCTGGTQQLYEVVGASDGNCISGETVSDFKISGVGISPLYLSSIATFDTSRGDCSLPTVPSQLTTTVLKADTCVPTSTCSGDSNSTFSGRVCGVPSNYEDDMKATFGDSVPYVTVKTYSSGTSCDELSLLGITTYVADGKCHKASWNSSFLAIRTSDGASVVRTYDGSTKCDAVVSTWAATTSQTLGNSCTKGVNGIANTKVYGAGATPSYLSAVAVYDGVECGVPAQVSVTSGLYCQQVPCTQLGLRFFSKICPNDYFELAESIFSGVPYLVAEVYTEGTDCGVKEGATMYAADNACHVAMDGTTSYRANIDASDGVALTLYDDTSCEATTVGKLQLSAEQVALHSCVGRTKYYAFTPDSAQKTASPEATPQASTTASTGSGVSAANSRFSVSVGAVMLVAAVLLRELAGFAP